MSDELRDTIRRYYERVIARLQRRIEAETDIVGQYRLRRAARNRKKSLRELLTQGDQQVTIKPSATSNDGGPGSGNHGHKGVPGEIGGSAPSPSARGENPKCKGFASPKLEKAHTVKHGREYPDLTDEEYIEHAKEFIAQSCSGTVEGYATEKGEVVRFDTTTGEFGKGVPGGRIITCYIAKWDKKTGKSNLELANEYYERQKKLDGIEDSQTEVKPSSEGAERSGEGTGSEEKETPE